MNSETRFLKHNGIYYTNNNLANAMIDNLEIDFHKHFTLLELAVGEGHILVRGKNRKQQINIMMMF